MKGYAFKNDRGIIFTLTPAFYMLSNGDSVPAADIWQYMDTEHRIPFGVEWEEGGMWAYCGDRGYDRTTGKITALGAGSGSRFTFHTRPEV